MATLAFVYILVRVQEHFSVITSLVDGYVVVVHSIGHPDHPTWTPISFLLIIEGAWKIWCTSKMLEHTRCMAMSHCQGESVNWYDPEF